MLALLVLVPLALVLLLNLPFATGAMNRAACWAALGLTALQALWLLCPLCPAHAAEGAALYQWLGWSATLDDLARVLLLSVGLVGFVSLLVSRELVPEGNRSFLFANLVLLAVAGMNGVVLSQGFFSLYIFLEATAVASFVLIAFDRDRRALEGAFKYFVMSAVATAALLTAIALFLLVAGGTSFVEVATGLRASGTHPFALLAVGLFIAGLLVKGGLIPFHGWLPDAYSAAPAPTSVLLAGAVTKVCGIYTLIRVVTAVFGKTPQVQGVLLVVGVLSMVGGALLALSQRDFKRMLGYSSVSQMGYVVAGLGTFNPVGAAGALFHLFNHAVFKSLLFVNATAVERQAGTRDMDRLGGLADRMPVTGVTSVIGFLSTAGLPPLSGFWSKLLIVVGLWQSGHRGVAAVAVGTGVLTLAYFLSLQRRVFFGQVAASCENVQEAGPWLTAPAVLLAAITLGLGLAFPWLFETFLVPVRSLL